jgi:hypothetical protein
MNAATQFQQDSGRRHRVRQIRNAVMHFDPDIQDDAVQELRDFVRFLREIAPSDR